MVSLCSFIHRRLRAVGAVGVTLTALIAAPGVDAQIAPPAMPVIIEAARVEAVRDTLEALGTLRANESVEVTAKVADVIAAIHFDDGQRVKSGQLLVQMSNAEEAALLVEAQSEAEEAARQLERVETLVTQGNAPASQLDERRRDAQSANARVNAVRSRLQDRVITAPFAGVVGLRQVSPGALVAPGTIITTLVDDSVMKLDFPIPAIYLGTLSPGAAVTARTPGFPDRTFSGTVTSVDSVINPATRSITVRARIPNESQILVPGMLMTLLLERNARDALEISESALVPRAARSFVYVVDPNAAPPIAEQREVTTGARRPGRVEITAGLEAGEHVITHGTLKVRPGAPVAIRAIDDGSRPLEELIKSAPAESRP
ncbi:MAG TPA: efflux transporter periplasmic adaptor subunit [Gammaproteobacteria bacterium]|jgi:membrane fusion protein (multidrug efflux system)|nr:efflux transporter periplasmic adaptor subunit [Gammaproteobacteria bacterium]